VLDVNAVITNVSGILTRAVGEAAELDLQLSPCLALVKVDGGKVEQSLMHLAVN